MKRFRVLLVDDEQRVLDFISSKLRPSGYDVITAKNGTDALEQVNIQEPDLVVLDLMMRGVDGFNTLRKIRTLSVVPIIILISKGANIEKIKGVVSGVDDVLAKPFDPDDLIARIETVRKRLSSTDKRKSYDQLTFGELKIDFNKRLVTLQGKEVHLTRIEWYLLSELAQNAGNIILYGDLLTRVWGPEYREDVQILRTWISRLRNKVENDSTSKLIRTVPKTGYMIDLPIA
jgi:two-component system KDP operon response regulator KdpE